MTPWYAQRAVALERRLGDPAKPGPCSWRAARQRDATGTFPAAGLAAAGLDRLHLPGHPDGWVGLEELAFAGRALARREPALALTAGMRAWSLVVWMAGTPAQQAAARRILARGGGFAFAASERAHGADLLQTGVVASRTATGWCLTGEKWPIGLAGRAAALLVLARTADTGPAPRQLGLFLVQRDAAPPDTLVALGRAATSGMRATDVGGVGFRGLHVPGDALLGGPGDGLELTLKLFQLTRPLVCSLALGIADTALRLAVQRALGRRLYGGPLEALPTVRARLGGAFVDLLAAEAVTAAAVRCAQVAPDQLQVASLVAKAVVPALTGAVLAAAGEVLGAAGYLRDGPYGVLGMLKRDHDVLAIFDGSTPVCLAALGAAVPGLVARWPERDPARRRRIAVRNHVRFDPALAPPPVRYDRLTLACRQDDVVAAATDGAPAAWTAAWRALRDAPARRGLGAAQAARRYATLHTAACCLHRGAAFPVPDLALHRLLDRPDGPEARWSTAYDAAFDALRERVVRARMLSLDPIALPDAPLEVPDAA